MTEADSPRVVSDDGLYLPEIKRHSLEKIQLHNRFSRIFSAGMHKKWHQRAYIGLFAGAGAARLSDTGEVVETSSLAVHRQDVPFTHHVYVDQNPDCIAALKARVARAGGASSSTFIQADVNESAEEVRRALPSFGPERGLLSFGFVDPFDLQLRFATIRSLSSLKIDLLVLLMLGVDGRRNFRTYLDDRQSTRIADFLDSPNWRDEFARLAGRKRPVHFLLDRFDERMVALGYHSAKPDIHRVCAYNTQVLQYLLAFYSKSETGVDFWKKTRRSVSDQYALGL